MGEGEQEQLWESSVKTWIRKRLRIIFRIILAIWPKARYFLSVQECCSQNGIGTESCSWPNYFQALLNSWQCYPKDSAILLSLLKHERIESLRWWLGKQIPFLEHHVCKALISISSFLWSLLLTFLWPDCSKNLLQSGWGSVGVEKLSASHP